MTGRRCVIQLLEVAGVSDDEVRRVVPTWEPGGYVAAYDPEGGIASLVVTTDPAGALVLSSRGALDLWQSSPSWNPVRPDGRPNRPLTAFTVAIDDAPPPTESDDIGGPRGYERMRPSMTRPTEGDDSGS